MQPAARLTAAIELLSDIEAKIAARGAPADVLVQGFFRARRYAGSKDRRAVTGYVYGVLRNRALYMWALSQCRADVTARNLILVHLMLTDEAGIDLFGLDSPFAPTALTFDEEEMLGRLRRLKLVDAPIDVRVNLPHWALDGMTARFGNSLQVAAEALNETAPMDIRLNSLKPASQSIIHKFNSVSEVFIKNRFSEFGYRAIESINLGGDKAYKDGLIEVQDEAAQVASALVEARPGMQVIDLCAGAGGKSLALAAAMEGKGQIHAFDVSSPRLAALKTRMQRAAARNIQVHRIAPDGPGREIAFGPFAAKADRVVVDAPCTGTGTWRRSPDQRWRFDRDGLRDMAALQLSLLKEAATMVAPGGRLVYMTCSVLPEENEQVVEAFMGHGGAAWRLMDYRTIWQNMLPGEPAETLALDPACLQLAPHAHGTDGFFCAIFERPA